MYERCDFLICLPIRRFCEELCINGLIDLGIVNVCRSQSYDVCLRRMWLNVISVMAYWYCVRITIHRGNCKSSHSNSVWRRTGDWSARTESLLHD